MNRTLGTILIATDFSDAAANALARGAALARQHGAKLRLVHSTARGDWLARLVDQSHGAFSQEMWANAAAAALARIRLELQQQGHRDVAVEVVEEPLHLALGHFVQDEGVGLLVMGAHGEGRFRDALLGSTADRVLRAGAVAVLLVRSDAGAQYHRVALATDCSPVSVHAAALGLHLVPDATHYLVHASDIPLDRSLAFANVSGETLREFRSEHQQKVGQRLEAFASEVGPAAQAAIRAPREGAPGKALDAFVLEAGIDLMVLGSRARARWEANLLGSTALFAVTGLACDVLLVPEPAA